MHMYICSDDGDSFKFFIFVQTLGVCFWMRQQAPHYQYTYNIAGIRDVLKKYSYVVVMIVAMRQTARHLKAS